MGTPRLPKYAADTEVPICILTPVRLLNRGDWIIGDWGGSQPKAMCIVGLDYYPHSGRYRLDLAFYISTERVYPERIARWCNGDDMFSAITGYVDGD